MPKAPKLKIYCMPAGFYDAIVAAPSQAAALKAWGTTTNLFAAGRASVVADEDDPSATEARARPGTVVKRSRGDEAAMLGPEPAPKAKQPHSRSAPKAKPRPETIKPPDRSALDAAEIALAEAERSLDTELDAIRTERATLDERERNIRSKADAEITRLTKAKDAKARQYELARRSGG